MPRGQYDRSHLKAKRAAAKAAKSATKATVAAEMVLSKSKSYASKEYDATPEKPVSHDIYELRKQIECLAAALEKISNNTQSQHSPTLLTAFETEIIATLGTMKTWREAAFPVAEKKAPAAPAAAPAPVATKPATPPMPAPLPATGVAPAPLPFTPAAVQEVMKQAQG